MRRRSGLDAWRVLQGWIGPKWMVGGENDWATGYGGGVGAGDGDAASQRSTMVLSAFASMGLLR